MSITDRQLSAYIGTNVKCLSPMGNIFEPCLTMQSVPPIDSGDKRIPMWYCLGENACKLILRPLSDLTKVVKWFDGLEMSYIERLFRIKYKYWTPVDQFGNNDFEVTSYSDGMIQCKNKLYYRSVEVFTRISDDVQPNLIGQDTRTMANNYHWIMQFLHENHFDTMNLIGNGAVDINTLKGPI